jgi:hypothetical protein
VRLPPGRARLDPLATMISTRVGPPMEFDIVPYATTSNFVSFWELLISGSPLI